MRGSVKWQVNTILNEIREIGSSRHEAKQQTTYNNPHELAQQTGIHSYKTLDTYRGVAKDLLQYAKDNGFTKDIEKLTCDAVKSFLDNKLEQGISYNTLKTYMAAIGKLEVALQAHNGSTYDLSQAAAEVLQQAREGDMGPKEQHRAFQDPQAVIQNISNPEYRTIAQFQLASGLRLSELNHIRPDQLQERDSRMFVSVEQGKGGKDRIVEVKDRQAFQAFKSLVESKQQTQGRYKGKFVFSKSGYRASVASAAKRAGETERGTHSFRWNYAQKEYIDKQISLGKPESQAKLEVSHELGHNRESITDHYLHR